MKASASSSAASLPHSAPVLLVMVVIGLLYSSILSAVNKTVPDAYMDEIFHIPQAQKYCAGRFDEWDPKITTFPGLYLVSTLYAKAIWTLQLGDFCSVSVLRSLNVVFALGNVVLCVLLRKLVSPLDPNVLLHALRIAAFPPLFFFSFLFYTDAGATFFVLLMVVLAERVDLLQCSPVRGSFMLSAMSGAVSVLFRQTNIIWVVFVAGTVVVRSVELAHSKFIYGSSKQDSSDKRLSSVMHSPFRVIFNFISVIISTLPSILFVVWPFAVIVLCFLAFLVKNGGIVVGDKSNHEVTFHGAQLLYFTVAVASGFGLNLTTPSQLQKFLTSVQHRATSFQGIISIGILVAVIVGVIHCFSPIHKFMLADNRHYTFYIWRKFFRRHEMAKFFPIPLYLFFGWRCWDELNPRCSPLWKFIYVLAVCLVLLPSPLVEPRYYCLPFVLFHLNTRNQSGFHLWLVTAAYMVVNASTLYIFLYRPFIWVDGSTARFMW
ncbi:putative alpha-2-glucosyltransferase Alg10 [Plasmopara halstedii]